jgi:GH24 family phage-related lysozyme (muramidase)
MNKLIDQLKVHEGSRTHAYDCPAGYITIGVGRNIDPNGGLGLSEDEIRLPIKE